jgi:hypothetical protein
MMEKERFCLVNEKMRYVRPYQEDEAELMRYNVQDG